MKTSLVVGFILAISVGLAYFVWQSPIIKEAHMGTNEKFELNSSVFAENGDIPDKYTCKGEKSSPPLQISGVPAGTASLAIIVHDPDAPLGDFTHWIAWNIDPETTNITENALPNGSVQGKTGFGNVGYGAPCPPSGTHHYEFELYALRTKLTLPAGSSRQQLEAAMKDHVRAQTKLVGLVSAN